MYAAPAAKGARSTRRRDTPVRAQLRGKRDGDAGKQRATGRDARAFHSLRMLHRSTALHWSTAGSSAPPQGGTCRHGRSRLRRSRHRNGRCNQTTGGFRTTPVCVERLGSARVDIPSLHQQAVKRKTSGQQSPSGGGGGENFNQIS